ncbi:MULTISPECIES: hypothetical protein [Pseudomonas]|uniref:hypothetical protein n=1 Tax=Pseudomonas TaxID=286 RepID=UPI0004D604CE|nr:MULTISPECIES: hypothetical protein [Pseudomonas]AMO75854.1 hypothetical protein PcP3B5_24160 [Pseudomonas citronellolis]KES25005.1 hypothetical protein FG99_02575 [Pseudomonas sp. AAC]KWR81501.1 hypothetical protein RN02_10655 [Pseudomonas sp. PI1]MBH3436723.1 hypothetical protein [Pseudomonas citronellolis]OHS16315.1 hypothetical protein HMPREF3289_05190 [Pseudomonas sp. HMSC75E02]
MQELNIHEVEMVAGAGIIDDVIGRIGAAIMLIPLSLSTGVAKGVVTGGSVGGILGVGVASGAFGGVIGGVLGVIHAVTYGLVNGWGMSLETFNANAEGWWSMNVPAPQVGQGGGLLGSLVGGGGSSTGPR